MKNASNNKMFPRNKERELTVHPPPSMVMSQYTRFFTPVLRYIVYTPSMFFP